MQPRIIAVLAASAFVTASYAQDFAWGPRNTDLPPAFPEQFRAPLVTSDATLATSVVAGGLAHPWGIEILPDGSYLVTERPGRLRHVATDGTLSDPVEGVPQVVALQQGGLLDVALAPDFADSRMVYLSYAKPVDNGAATATAVARGVLSEDYTTLSEVEDIFLQHPAVPVPAHFGSRIVFDGDGHVFITTGEHFTVSYRQYAQDLDKTFGKVVRLNLDGSVPADNPFAGTEGADPSIWSLGHRNIQGAAMYDGALWTIEHGPAGGDELNTPQPAANYGWPEVSYGQNYNGQPVGSGKASAEGFEEPVYFWDPVIAPAGMHPYDGDMFPDWQGDLLIGSLTPGGVVRLKVEDGLVRAEERLLPDLGRVRDIEIDRDGSILVITDADDGALIRLTPAEVTE